MSKRTIYYQITIAAVLMSMLVLVPHIQAQMSEILIDNEEVYEDQKKSPVLFDHDLHMGVAGCMDCHHQYRDGENILEHQDLREGAEGVACRDCHAEPGTRFREGHDPTQKDLEEAYHSQCITCHRDMASDEATGPRTCMGCHEQ